MMTMDNGVETKTWEDFGFKPLKDHVNPSQASFKHRTLHIDGQPGKLYFGSEIEDRGTIEITLKRLVREEWQINHSINQLNKFLFDEFKNPRYLKTVFDYEPSKYVWLQVEQGFVLNRASALNEFTIPFMQLDDNKYSIAEADEIRWGNRKIDFLADYTLGNTGNGASDHLITKNTTLTPFLEGLALRPYIVLKGSGTDVRITCEGRSIHVGSFSNQTVEIDVENFIAYFNNYEKLINMDDFYFVPGKRVSVTGMNMNFKITFHYRDIYI